MHDIVREAELAVMEGYLMEGIKPSVRKAANEILNDFKKFPKANHVDRDYLALRPRQVTNFKRR
ncbi:hypothetical protein [Fibrobacter sp.]|uniref:hypothetical protein n=1 Tax=Fibrobacter sp. TaxID=35828 RepID=UPI00386AC4A8